MTLESPHKLGITRVRRARTPSVKGETTMGDRIQSVNTLKQLISSEVDLANQELKHFDLEGLSENSNMGNHAFRRLDFHYDTAVKDPVFGLVEDKITFRFGPNGAVGFVRSTGDSQRNDVDLRLGEFLDIVDLMHEYLVVENGVMNLDVVKSLKTGDYIIFYNDKPTAIALSKIRIDESSGKVEIFYTEEGRKFIMFDRIDNKGADESIRLFTRPDISMM